VAVAVGATAPDSRFTQLVEHFGAVPERSWWRLAVWTAFVALLTVAIRLLLDKGTHIPNKAILAASFGVGCCAALGASVHSFTTFVLSKRFRHLLEATSFSALGGGMVLQAIADFPSASPVIYEWILTAAWLVSATVFAGAAYSTTRWQTNSRLGEIVQVAVGGLLVLAFPLSALPHAISPDYLSMLHFSDVGVHISYLVENGANFLALLLLMVALMGYYRHRSAARRPLSLYSLFCAPCALGLIAHIASESRFDEWWATSQIMMSGAWLVLIGTFAVENARVHKEVVDRIDELETLHQISWSLVGVGSLRELLDMFASTLHEKLQAKVAVVFLGDESGHKLEVVGICGETETNCKLGDEFHLFAASRFPGFHSGHTARAYLTGEALVAKDVFVDVELIPWRTIAVENGCAISLPLIDRGKPIGVVDLYFSDCSQLTRQKIKLLTTIVAAATPAIEHAIAREVEAVSDDIDEHRLSEAA
jgi:hypothetical protein